MTMACRAHTSDMLGFGELSGSRGRLWRSHGQTQWPRVPGPTGPTLCASLLAVSLQCLDHRFLLTILALSPFYTPAPTNSSAFMAFSPRSGGLYHYTAPLESLQRTRHWTEGSDQDRPRCLMPHLLPPLPSLSHAPCFQI